MNIYEIILISVGLSMDAFAVSLCKGMSLNKKNYKKAFIVGLYFGLFQFIMPIIGFKLASRFSNTITNIDHWIAFFLLLFIGLKMIKDSILKENILDNNVNFKEMIGLAIATSIDALAVGITFSFLKVSIFSSSLLIGIITFILSFMGIIIGSKFGERLGNKSQVVGGFILIVMAFKIVFEHLNII